MGVLSSLANPEAEEYCRPKRKRRRDATKDVWERDELVQPAQSSTSTLAS